MNPVTAPLLNELHEQAEHMLNRPIQPLTFSGYQAYLDSGDRRLFEDQYFARRKQLAVMGLSQYFAPTPEKHAYLEEVLWAVLQEYSWGLPAHLPQTGDHYGTAAATWIDLFAAETAATLAELTALLGTSLHPQLQAQIDHELQRRIWAPFAAFDWGWQHKANNWSAVIGGCVGITALYRFSPNAPQLTAIFSRLDVAFATYLGSFGDDGASEEGVSYWAYGFGYYLTFAALAKAKLGTDRYLNQAKVAAIAAFPEKVQLNADLFVPFSDFDPIELPVGLLAYCRQQFGVKTPAITAMNPVDFDHCYRFAPLLRDVTWAPLKFDNTAAPAPSDQYLPSVQWWVVRNPGLMFAAKGGRNDESHNHIDLGHFVFGNNEQLWLTDVGAGEYTRDYFDDSKRYGYFAPSSAAHSVPEINGATQQPGAYAALATHEKDTLTLDLTAAYPTTPRLKHYQRRLQLDQTARRLTLSDTFACDHGANTARLVLIITVAPVLHSAAATAGACTIQFSDAPKLSVEPVTYQDHDNQPQTVYRLLADYSFSDTLTATCTLTLTD